MKKIDRRNFFKYGAAAFASLILSPIFSRKGSLAFAGGKPPLSPSDPTAQALGYNPDNRKVDTKKWTKKAGAAGKHQMCKTCQFYTPIDSHHGNCQIFVNNTVMSHGWCNSWTKKA